MNQQLRSITNSLCCLAILPFFRYVKCRNWCWKLWYKSEVTWNSDYTGSSRTMSKKSHAALKFCKRKAKQQAVSLKSCCSRCKRQSCIFVCFLETLGTKSSKVVSFLGDATEDPSHPKMVWPAPSECRQCRSERTDLLILDPQIAFVQGTLWNLTNLVEHNIKVYAGQHLRPIDLTAFRGNIYFSLSLKDKVVEKLWKLLFLKCAERENIDIDFFPFL